MKKQNNENWLKKIKTANEKSTKILGYNPKIERLPEKNPDVKNKKVPTVYLHGWGDSKDGIKGVKSDIQEGSFRIPGDIICFNFEDATINGHLPITKSSLGQKKDILPTILVFELLNSLYNSWNIYGHSRGGAVAVNTIGVLNKPNQDWRQELKKLGINKKLRKSILEKIEKGVVVLDCPLTEVKPVIRKSIKDIASVPSSSLSKWVPDFLKRAWNSMPDLGLTGLSTDLSLDVSTTSTEGSMSILMPYKPWREQAIKSLDNWKGLNIKTLLHFQHNDRVLSNKNDVPFAQKLIERNPKSTWIVLGSDGGHCSGFQTIYKVIHALNKRSDGPYLDLKYLLEKGEKILKKSQPSPENVEKYIKSYYAKCAKAECAKKDKIKNKK